MSFERSARRMGRQLSRALSGRSQNGRFGLWMGERDAVYGALCTHWRRAPWLHRIIREEAPVDGASWGVARVNDSGEQELVHWRIPEPVANRLAGKMRDACPERDVEDGWNYLPVKLRRRGAL